MRIFKKKDFIYLFDREHKQGEQQRKREKQTACWAGSLIQDMIPGRWDHDLSWKQTLNQQSHPGALHHYHFKRYPRILPFCQVYAYQYVAVFLVEEDRTQITNSDKTKLIK